ncbi:hypothetical protein HII36_24165 [Nonomuraea sp. NN258]|uniref:hypothetical protein n=1 Tax=Nonomuraea antri TaxID=2730852 RepID=UPI001568FCDF|nr:hypothetical protein [Nonomuraea antri]NRQ34902.1 hypothetical protein [Nonomuraea antri]
MPHFQRLTIEEARNLTRDELLPRIEEEQKYWYSRIHNCEMKAGDDAAFRTFNEIMHTVIDAVADGRPTDQGYYTQTLAERGEL